MQTPAALTQTSFLWHDYCRNVHTFCQLLCDDQFRSKRFNSLIVPRSLYFHLFLRSEDLLPEGRTYSARQNACEPPVLRNPTQAC